MPLKKNARSSSASSSGRGKSIVKIVSMPSVSAVSFNAATTFPPACSANSFAVSSTGSAFVPCVTVLLNSSLTPARARNSRVASAPSVTASSIRASPTTSRDE